MPRIALDLSSLIAHRGALQALRAEQRVLDDDLRRQRSALEAQVRAGASADATTQLQQHIRDAEAARQALVDRRREFEGRHRPHRGWLPAPAGSRHVLPKRWMAANRSRCCRCASKPATSRFPRASRMRCASASTRTISTRSSTRRRRPTGNGSYGTGYWRARLRRRRGRGRALCARSRAGVRSRTGGLGAARHDARRTSIAGRGRTRSRSFPDLDTIDAKAKETRAVLLAGSVVRDRLRRRTARSVSRLGQSDSRRAAALSRTGSTPPTPNRSWAASARGSWISTAAVAKGMALEVIAATGQRVRAAAKRRPRLRSRDRARSSACSSSDWSGRKTPRRRRTSSLPCWARSATRRAWDSFLSGTPTNNTEAVGVRIQSVCGARRTSHAA